MSEQRKAGALKRGRLMGGKDGAALVAAELAAWSRRAVRYLDSRNPIEPLSLAKLRRGLFKRSELNPRQRLMVQLAWMLSGHIVVDAAGELRDTRAVWHIEPQADLTHRTAEAARKLAALLSLPSVERQLVKLARVQARWGQLSWRLKSTARGLVRAAHARINRRQVQEWMAQAQARDAAGAWSNVGVDVIAAAALVRVNAITGLPIERSLVSLHRSARDRLFEAGQRGISPPDALRVLTSHWSATMAHYAELSAKEGRTIRPRHKVLREPLTHPKAFENVCERIVPVGTFSSEKSGTFDSLNVPKFAVANSAQSHGKGGV